MKNRYVILGDVTIIYLDHKDGNETETAISTRRLQHLLAYPVKWSAAWRQSTKSYYVTASVREKGKRKTVYMHRFLMRPRCDQETDHRNNDTLNNTDDNLRNCAPRTNCLNRRTSKTKRRAKA